mgnify:CR=1 FL=1
MSNTIIVINALELASNLAHDRTLYESEDICNNEDDMYKLVNSKCPTHEVQYTEEIQDRFNAWYDYYLDKINKCIINE